MSKQSGLRPMDAEQLREEAHKMVDFIADYYKTIENFPVLSQVEVVKSPAFFYFQFLYLIFMIFFVALQLKPAVFFVSYEVHGTWFQLAIKNGEDFELPRNIYHSPLLSND